ncbi:MAG: AI-2E family transporter [Pseudonocardiaceae bacterium]|nr:AI-2E family transporter [Pseudonocardiaceae bacterium]
MSGGPTVTEVTESGAARPLLRAGRMAWAALGIAGLLVVAWLVVSQLAFVVVPLLLALFAAALLAPIVAALSLLRVPRPLGALLALVVALAAAAGVFALVVPSFMAQLPALVESLTRAAGELDELLRRLPFVSQDTNVREIAQQVLAQLSGAGGLRSLLGSAANVLAGLVLLAVVLFFYLAQGQWLVSSVTGQLPSPRREQADELVDRLWHTLGTYFRALIVVALVDAVLIGSGLALLGVPLALPLAVLVFLGGFFPYVGATVSGLLAALVALAESGLGTALAVLVLVLAVQQLEGNVIQPLVMGKLVKLPAFVVLLAIAVGATLLGVLGAFLAVPAAACIARVAGFLREQRAAVTA